VLLAAASRLSSATPATSQTVMFSLLPCELGRVIGRKKMLRLFFGPMSLPSIEAGTLANEQSSSLTGFGRGRLGGSGFGRFGRVWRRRVQGQTITINVSDS